MIDIGGQSETGNRIVVSNDNIYFEDMSDNDDSSLNGTDELNVTCGEGIPRAIDILKNQGVTGTVVVALAWVCLIIVLGLFIDMIVFVKRNFLGRRRRTNTVTILGLAPIFATCAMIGLMIPRAGTLVDLLANSYFAGALYSLVCLIEEFLGPSDMKDKCKNVVFHLNTPPCFCCCPCLPKIPFSRATYTKLLVMVFQVTLVRPTLMFLAAVLWADGDYTPGSVSPRSAFVYITILNALSSMTAVYGLVIMQKAFLPLLLKHRVIHKFLYIQLTIVGTVLGNIVIAVLVSKSVIPCTAFLASPARAHRIYHCFVVGWTLLVSFWGRVAFRHKEDGLAETDEETYLQAPIPEGVASSDKTTQNDHILEPPDGAYGQTDETEVAFKQCGKTDLDIQAERKDAIC